MSSLAITTFDEMSDDSPSILNIMVNFKEILNLWFDNANTIFSKLKIFDIID